MMSRFMVSRCCCGPSDVVVSWSGGLTPSQIRLLGTSLDDTGSAYTVGYDPIFGVDEYMWGIFNFPTIPIGATITDTTPATLTFRLEDTSGIAATPNLRLHAFPFPLPPTTLPASLGSISLPATSLGASKWQYIIDGEELFQLKATHNPGYIVLRPDWTYATGIEYLQDTEATLLSGLSTFSSFTYTP